MFPFTEDCLAACDIEDARRWYEQKAEGLGRKFTRAVAETYLRIAENPELYPRADHRTRKCRVRDFPYGVVYLFDGELVKIVAVLHAKRGPKSLTPRLPNESEH